MGKNKIGNNENKMKILLVMKFWDDGHPNSTRIRNVIFTWKEMKELSVFLKQNNIDCECKLYDFSPFRIIEDSIHIPYDLGVYKKSEKTNKIIEQNDLFDFIFMFDCDTFFVKEDFSKVLDLLKNLKSGDIFTFDLAKLEESNIDEILSSGIIDQENTNWSYAYSGKKEHGPLSHGHNGNLGGVYVCDLKLIKNTGGFDETYVGWGGEDGEMLGKIYCSNMSFNHTPVRSFAPFHLPHFYDWGNEKYSKRFNK